MNQQQQEPTDPTHIVAGLQDLKARTIALREYIKLNEPDLSETDPVLMSMTFAEKEFESVLNRFNHSDCEG